MGVLITGVEKGSPAEKHNIQPLETLYTINGHPIEDVLDYRFYMVDRSLVLELGDTGGHKRVVSLKKPEYDDLGLCFETYLMDKKHACRNRCIFCFIDQLPKGMRESLYFKDDDERLSFLFGNYITLTNLSEREVERIIAMHISPVNISVHTTNPELRVRMMGNKNAGTSLEIPKRFAEAGTVLNCQLVLCRGINDGPELERSLRDLADLYPAVQSIAAVPVGLTRYRQGLHELEPYDAASAREVVRQIEVFGDRFLSEHGTRLVYPADEFYLKAGIAIHETDFYEGFEQLENGVGMLASLLDQFEAARGGETDTTPRKISIATGVAAHPFLERLAAAAMEDSPSLDCRVYAIKNEFLGENVNVAGLVTGQDLIAQLTGKPLGDRLLIPTDMLRNEGDMFLDSVTLDEVRQALGVPVIPIADDGQELYEALAGKA